MTSLSIQSQTLGKVFKDHGDWAESEAEVREHLTKYAVRGSQFEGWGAGDLAHLLMEMFRSPEADPILLEYLEPRQKLLKSKGCSCDRRSDTMYLEMQLGECPLQEERYTKAEEKLQELLARFCSFGTLWHFEKFRVFFIICALA